jgi:hypothetical protein
MAFPYDPEPQTRRRPGSVVSAILWIVGILVVALIILMILSMATSFEVN